LIACAARPCSIAGIRSGRLQPPYPPRIIDETDDFVVIDKPPFLPVHPTRPDETGTLWDELRALLAYELANGGQVSIINRLDRETSGLTLVAKSREAARYFSMRMMTRSFSKEYLAIVFGWPPDEWTVDAPLLRQGNVRPSPVWVKQCSHPDGAAAITEFRAIHRFEREEGRFALVRAYPETGRMHQIRAHLAKSGHPIVGDKLYVDERCYLEFIETGWTPSLAKRLLLPRQALHSMRLSVERWDWRSELPADLAAWAH
jgi:23S rRNA pseudouridine1911/1915/1917 synthase